MKQRTKIIVLIIIIALLVLFLNRSYARIYDYMGEKNLPNPNVATSYDLGNNKSSTTAVYVAIGDSLTAGVGCGDYKSTFPYLLMQDVAKAQGKNFKVVNLGTPSAKSQDVIDSQLASAVKINPDYVSIFIGINDMHDEVLFEQFEKNLNQIVSELKNKTKSQIIMANLPDVGSPKLIMPPFNWYFSWRTGKYNAVIDKVCKEQNIRCLDLRGINRQAIKEAGNDFYSQDLFHPSCVGYNKWSQGIYANISR